MRMIEMQPNRLPLDVAKKRNATAKQKYHITHKEKEKLYRLNNKENRAKYDRLYREKNQGKIQEYRKTHKKETQEYRKKKRVEINVYTREYYSKNLDSYRKRNKKYRDLHKEERKKYPSSLRRQEYDLKRNYGVSKRQYLKLLKKQKGVCAICKNEEVQKINCKIDGRIRALSVDHDHETNKVRGILCYKCNTGLGMFKDNPELLERAKAYIIKSKI